MSLITTLGTALLLGAGFFRPPGAFEFIDKLYLYLEGETPANWATPSNWYTDAQHNLVSVPGLPVASVDVILLSDAEADKGYFATNPCISAASIDYNNRKFYITGGHTITYSGEPPAGLNDDELFLFYANNISCEPADSVFLPEMLNSYDGEEPDFTAGIYVTGHISLNLQN